MNTEIFQLGFNVVFVDMLHLESKVVIQGLYKLFMSYWWLWIDLKVILAIFLGNLAAETLAVRNYKNYWYILGKTVLHTLHIINVVEAPLQKKGLKYTIGKYMFPEVWILNVFQRCKW